MKRKYIVILCLVLALAGGAYYFKSKSATTPAATTTTKAAVTELLAADLATLQNIQLAQTLSANGNIRALKQAQVKSQVSAIVLSVNVQEGQNVSAGTVLAITDLQDYQSRVAAQQAAVTQALTQVSIAQRTVDNNKALVGKGFISNNAVDTATQQLEAAKASVAVAQANLDLAKKALADTKIVAPISGVVTEKLIADGDKVSPEMRVFTIVAPGAVEFEGSLPAAEAAQLKTGQTIIISPEGLPSIRTSISRINATVSNGSRNVNFYAKIDAQPELRPGTFASAKILVKSIQVPAVPLAAVRDDGGRSIVYTLNSENNTLQSTVVTTGLRGENDTGEAYIAVDGLPSGARYVTRNLGPLRVGSTAKLSPTK